MHLQIEGTDVSLDKSRDFAETIVRDTLRGMIRHMKGVDPESVIRIEAGTEGSLESTQIITSTTG